jgi:hypothetical protein
MIGQYLSNTNEKATVPILQNILELNKARIQRGNAPKSPFKNAANLKRNSKTHTV